ncbi:MAG TPA: hypothetical protein VEC19_13005 [Usitatibacter sp.]|nr:hypothetical protein [Usitatibacter sp.]
MPLALSIPPDRAVPPKDLELRPRHVKAWLESLPMQQAFEATRQLTAHLGAANRARFDLEARLQILEIYRPFAATLLDEMDAIYGKSTLPLGPRAREALTLARDFAAELALGYKIAAVEKSGKLFGGKKQLPVLLLRAAEYVFVRLKASYKSYTPAPPGTWSDLHQLYLLADQEGLAREAADPETKATVADIYCEALMLSLTDPYRLPQGETDRVLAQLRGYRGLPALGQARPATPSGGHFLVPCDLDRPPKPALSANDDTGGPNWRLLDANPVVEKILMKKRAMETGQVSATLSKAMGPDGIALMAKLATLWGDPPKRTARRDPTKSTVALCVGMKAVTHFVSLEPKLDLATEDEMLRRGITMPLFALPMDDASQPIPVFEWDVVNQSAGGIKVRRMGPTQQPIAVGEVVGIKFTGKAHWTIGVVRWLTIFDEGGMEFGLQFLAAMARMVWVQPTITSSPQAKLGLLMGDAPDQLDVLLTPINTFADLREFELDEEGNVTCVRASGLMEKTGRFELFQVTPS